MDHPRWLLMSGVNMGNANLPYVHAEVSVCVQQPGQLPQREPAGFTEPFSWDISCLHSVIINQDIFLCVFMFQKPNETFISRLLFPSIALAAMQWISFLHCLYVFALQRFELLSSHSGWKGAGLPHTHTHSHGEWTLISTLTCHYAALRIKSKEKNNYIW